MSDIGIFVMGMAVMMIVLCVMAAIADWLGEPERQEARRRNHARPWDDR